MQSGCHCLATNSKGHQSEPLKPFKKRITLKEQRQSQSRKVREREREREVGRGKERIREATPETPNLKDQPSQERHFPSSYLPLAPTPATPWGEYIGRHHKIKPVTFYAAFYKCLCSCQLLRTTHDFCTLVQPQVLLTELLVTTKVLN